MTDLFFTGRSAEISVCGSYRYRLERLTQAQHAARKTMAVVMVNPSTANAVVDDATIRKVQGFALRHGAHRVIVGNLFAFRATDIKALRTAADPIGPDNDRHLEQILRDADLHIVAWGPLAKLPPHLRNRWHEVFAIADRVGCSLHCLGTARDGQPRHPLMLSYETSLDPWHPPISASAAA